MNIPFLNAQISEDFTTYTETGDTGNMLSQNSTHAIWEQLDRNYDTWIYKDYGANYFGDFEHQFTFNVTEMEAGDANSRFSVNLHIVSQTNVSSNPPDALILYVNQITTSDITYNLVFFQIDGGVSQFISLGFDNTLNVGTEYYATITKNEDICRCIIFSDVNRTTVKGDTGNQTGVDEAYRYLQTTKGIDVAQDSSDYSSGYITDLCFRVEIYITFYFNDGGEFRVDNATMTNGTENTYVPNSVLELASLPQNSSYIFSYFEWDSTNATTNPYNLTLTSNSTVWCYFDVAGVVGGYAGFSYLFFGLIIGVIVGGLVLASKNH